MNRESLFLFIGLHETSFGAVNKSPFCSTMALDRDDNKALRVTLRDIA
jgi:hypothetical protein